MNHEHKLNNEQLKRMEKAIAGVAEALNHQREAMEAQNRLLVKLTDVLKEGKDGTP